MHAIIAFEKDLQVVDVTTERKVNAIDYLCQHATYEGKRIFRNDNGRPALPTRDLRYGLKESFKVQDHADQFLMAFADADVSLDTAIVAEGGKKFTVRDMLAATKTTFRDEQELGWTLVVTATYLSLESRWTADSGKDYGSRILLRWPSDATRERKPRAVRTTFTVSLMRWKSTVSSTATNYLAPGATPAPT